MLHGITSAEEAIVEDKNPKSMNLDAASGIEGSFFYSWTPAKTPLWVSFVQPLLSSPLPALTNSSTSGLLIVKSENHFFALTFGYGRTFLDLSKVKHQFGLRVALNRIDHRHIRSLDTKTFEDMVVTKNTQSSKSSELPIFGVDISKDILRAVTGEPRDRAFAKRISGSDALVINLDTLPVDLPKLCNDLREAFEEDTYKTNFGWIDHLSLVQEASTIRKLEDLLEKQLRGGDTSNTHLAVPETINWEDIDVFKISGSGKEEYEDLDLDLYLSKIGDQRAEITLSKLRSRRVSVRFSRSAEFDSRWSLFQCLVTEQRVDNKLHVLIEGRWFAVDESLVSKVDTFAASLPASPTLFIKSEGGEAEASYNARLSESAPEEMLLLDARIKRPGGATSGIELCDVLTANGEFIHVKRKSRSSTLSHLFAQGAVSGTTFVSDGKFRDEMRKVIEEKAEKERLGAWLELIPADTMPLDRTKYTVSYVVIANSNRTGTDWLPFFSKLNLMQQGQQLVNLGFKVSVSRVSVVTQ
ncbi:DUF6119 family protein [Paenarthrobacter nicotinovorans]|uniref:DUF6119 family protein n=1 Tax=Paenarthrobacter nicotinovorans TaxID=29320 RepID=UPI003801BDFF